MKRAYSGRQMEIIKAAGKIINQSGFGSLTVKNLAKEMKFTEGALYRHFVSKEELLLAMLNYLSTELDRLCEEAVQTSGNPVVQLKELFHSKFTYFKKNQHYLVAVFSEGLMEENTSINEAIYQLMTIQKKYLTAILLQGQKENQFTNAIKHDDLSHIIMGTVRLHLFKWKLSGFQFDLVKRGDELLLNLIKLIEPKS